MRSSSSSSAPSRFIAAFPNGNTGALVYFVPSSSDASGNATLGASLTNGSLKSYEGSNNQTGIEGEISVSADLTFGVTLSESRRKGVSLIKHR